MIGKARMYPPNLGVGMPYDANIDTRTEFFLEGLCQEGLKKPDKARIAFDRVISQEQWPVGTGTLITAWAMRKTGQVEKGETLLNLWSQQSPTNPMASWSLAAYKNMSVPAFPDGEGLRLIHAIYLLNP